MKDKKIIFIFFFLIVVIKLWSQNYTSGFGDTAYINNVLAQIDKSARVDTQFFYYQDMIKLAILIVFSGFLTYIYLNYTEENKVISQAFINKKISFQLFEVQSANYLQILQFFTFAFLLVSGFYLYLSFHHASKKISAIIILVPFAFYFLVFLSSKIWQKVLDTPEVKDIIILNTQITAVIALPVVFLSIFFVALLPKLYNSMFILPPLFLLLIYATRLYNLTIYFFHKKLSLLLLILYLCTVEILPFLLLLKNVN